MVSALFKIARGLNDGHLRDRTHAAMFLEARVRVASSAPKTTELYFAIWTLTNSGQMDQSMFTLVASDSAVTAAITVSGEVPNTDGVDDADIIRVVHDNWTLISKQYTTNPLGEV